MHRLASCHEELIFDRIEKNRDDPGCRLSYGFLLHGDIVASVLDDALYTLICRDYRAALSTFVRRESGLHVYPAAMPENVLEYVESALHSDAVFFACFCGFAPAKPTVLLHPDEALGASPPSSIDLQPSDFRRAVLSDILYDADSTLRTGACLARPGR
jgi:hypothetical protein